MGAIAHMALRKATHYIPQSIIVLYFSVISAGLSFPFLLFQTNANILNFSNEIMMMCLSGLIAQLLLTKAYSLAKASLVSVFSFTGVLFSAFYGVIIFNESLHGIQWLGVVLLLLGISLATLFSQVQKSIKP